ncbi:hypothetical protein PYCCODRAFT_302385 [Trametes coccinea BRFM310]|uniref:Uncharacterized protein n=1 Tax=Trametes coccinea (strain BRFM310) TaxID=1353009 RepID=A0A1Y2IQ54_TRAC3|nr:hypothetical protein PYCCODRAFT_302385 [Trametes coccinea BRFM310]
MASRYSRGQSVVGAESGKAFTACTLTTTPCSVRCSFAGETRSEHQPGLPCHALAPSAAHLPATCLQKPYCGMRDLLPHIETAWPCMRPQGLQMIQPRGRQHNVRSQGRICKLYRQLERQQRPLAIRRVGHDDDDGRTGEMDLRRRSKASKM